MGQDKRRPSTLPQESKKSITFQIPAFSRATRLLHTHDTCQLCLPHMTKRAKQEQTLHTHSSSSWFNIMSSQGMPFALLPILLLMSTSYLTDQVLAIRHHMTSHRVKHKKTWEFSPKLCSTSCGVKLRMVPKLSHQTMFT